MCVLCVCVCVCVCCVCVPPSGAYMYIHAGGVTFYVCSC